MRILLTAHESRRGFLLELGLAYSYILSRHELIAPEEIASWLDTRAGLNVTKMLPGFAGGDQQIISKIESGEVDMVIFLRDKISSTKSWDMLASEIMERCNVYNIPLATNPASAELIILGLARGDVNWRAV